MADQDGEEGVYNSSHESYPSSCDEGLSNSFDSFLTIGIRTKIFNDMIHTHLELPGLCFKIINTPEFQRLRNLKQLGLCYHVYPSACHNRFEHCIGTSYLAGKYGGLLRKNQPELKIDAKDVLCLYVAGLCHDLGHGPFSHTWERFMHHHKPDYSHEEMSIRILDHLINENKLWDSFQGEDLVERDLTFIKELILGHPLPGEGTFKGRNPSKFFLYQIVSNDETKIDVDKFDYILRDCKQLNVTTAFDYERIFDNSHVFGIIQEEDGSISVADKISSDTPTRIAYRKKISENLEDLFKGRFSLHQKAYQHRVTRIIEEMVLDGLQAAEPHFIVTGKDGKPYKLSTACEDISAFIKLTDAVFELICQWGNGGPKASTIFEDVIKRNLYKCMGYVSGPFDEKAMEELLKLDSNLVLIKTKINYGSGDRNPLNEVLFYEKNRPNKLIRKVFDGPKTEAKCFIVLKPNYDKEASLVVGELVNREEVDRRVKVWARKYDIEIELE